MFSIKPVLLLIVLCFCSNAIYAQGNFTKNEIEIAYGMVTAPEIPGTTSRFFNANGNSSRIDNITGIGGFSIAYNRYLSKRFCIGATGVYSKATITYRVPTAKFDWAVFTVLLNSKYNYVFDPLFHLYSGLSVGLSSNNIIGSVKGGNQAFAYHARLIGARFGAKFGAFAELGFGYEGILKAGVSLQF